MISIKQLLVLNFCSLALAQTQHTIDVGAGGELAYNPTSVTAAVGDTVLFTFNQKSIPHNVGTSSFASPCAPSTSGASFYSTSLVGGMNFTITVNDTNPIYFYCGVSTHCLSGMVGVINPSSGMSATDFGTAARAVSSVTPYTATTAFGGALNKAAVAAASGAASAAASSSTRATSAAAAASGSATRAATATTSAAAGGAAGTTTSAAASTSSAAAKSASEGLAALRTGSMAVAVAGFACLAGLSFVLA